MNTRTRRGVAAIAAAALSLTIGVTSALAGTGATVETFSLDNYHEHHEPNGDVFTFDTTGTVRIVTTPDGRQSATVQYDEVQTLISGGTVVMTAFSSGKQHALSLGEDQFQVHLSSRSEWSNEFGEFSDKYLLQIVNGVVVMEQIS
jgi:hypothetical protein